MNKSVYRFVEAKAPVNIAVIKYWGKKDDNLKIPLNDSLSGTLNVKDMCTTTSVKISDELVSDELILNGQSVELRDGSPVTQMLKTIRSLSPIDELLGCKVRIVSDNNFPTAAGLASSAAGFSCLAYALGHAYGIEDNQVLSRIARNGSGSACRSLFGGFVHWIMGSDHETSLACQVVDENHWPEMRVIICVVNDTPKEVSSSLGMAQSVKTSSLIKYRADEIIPERIHNMKRAIIDKDFQSFSDLVMRDSNQFHAICLDTFPPIFYLNETSRQIISICHLINSFLGENKIAYTFDAGPNACIYLLEDFAPVFIQIMNHFFAREECNNNAQISRSLEVRGQLYKEAPVTELGSIINHLTKSNVKCMKNSIKYLISTSIGRGPELIEYKESMNED